MDSGVIVTFILYFVVVFIIGIIAYKRTKDISDYILGGRRLSSLVSALSAGASDMSGWLLLGLPGLVYYQGLKGLWLAGGLLAGTYLNWTIVARRLRIFSAEFDNSITLPEFLENRFQDRSGLLRTISAGMILFFFTIYTSSGLVAGGKLFNSVFGIPYQTAMIWGAVSILVYTFMGGFLAVSWTDAFQATLMLIALLIVPWLAISQGGMELAGSLPREKLSLFGTDQLDGELLITIASLGAWGLGYFGQPHILARFMAIDSPKGISKARFIGTTWAALAMAGAILVGLAGSVYFKGGLHDAEKVFIFLVRQLMHPAVAGICLAGILAAIMSTADSQLLVSASALTEDFYRARLRKGASEQELMWVGRITVLAISLLAIWLARDPDSKVLDMVSYAWAGFGASFGPALILALFWREMTRAGALWGILTGGLCVVLWKNLHGGIFDLYEILPGFVLSTVSIVLVSLLTKGPDQGLKTRFEQCLKKL